MNIADTYLHQIPEKIIDEDWAGMSLEEQRAYFGWHGFIVIPNAISTEQLKNVFRDIQHYRPDSSPKTALRAFTQVPSFSSCIENQKIVPVVKNLLGEEILLNLN